VTEMMQAIFIAGITGGVASAGTVTALRVHIQYLKDHNVIQDQAIRDVKKEARNAMEVSAQAHTRMDIQDSINQQRGQST